MQFNKIFSYGIILFGSAQLVTATPALAHGNEKHKKSTTEKTEQVHVSAATQDTAQTPHSL